MASSDGYGQEYGVPFPDTSVACGTS